MTGLLFLYILHTGKRLRKQMLLSDCVQIRPETDPNICIIWLHGLGANGHDFEPIVPHLEINKGICPWFIFPNAPRIKVTINNSMMMPAWYDIFEMDINRKTDIKGINQSIDSIGELIEQIKEKIMTENIILAGFSQGGVIAYGAGVSYGNKLAGIIGLSTYFPKNLELVHHPANRKTEVFICHGLYDENVPVALGKEAKHYFEENGHKVQYNEYEMEHQVILPQCKQIGDWINSLFSSYETT